MSAAKRNAPAGGAARGEGDEHGDVLRHKHSTRPAIRVQDGQMHEILDQVDRVLGQMQSPIIFRKGSALIAVTDTDRRLGLETRQTAPATLLLTTAATKDRLTRAAAWEKWDQRAQHYKPIDCPTSHAQGFRERGEYRYVPEVTALTECPVVLSSGRVIHQGGYDRHTGIYVARAPRGGYRIGGDDRADAERALEVLTDLLAEFPFASDADRAAAIAGIMTPVAAPAIPACPLHLATAEAPGAGKSTVWDVAAILATGRPMPVISWPADAAEQEKRLHGVLLAGDPLASADNLERPLAGESLCQATTQPVMTVRALGASTMFQVPARVALYATGNNAVVRGDMTRRTVLTRLSTGVERPERRAFRRDILEHVRRHRDELLMHLTAIPRAYLADGQPEVGLAPYNSFGEWDLLVRRPLVWLGLPDPLEPSEALRADDPDRQDHRALLKAWHAHFGSEPQTAAEVIRAATETYPRMDGTTADDAPDLADAVTAVCTTGRGPKLDGRTLGFALRRYVDRIESGLRLERAGTDRTNTGRWQVREVGA